MLIKLPGAFYNINQKLAKKGNLNIHTTYMHPMPSQNFYRHLLINFIFASFFERFHLQIALKLVKHFLLEAYMHYMHAPTFSQLNLSCLFIHLPSCLLNFVCLTTPAYPFIRPPQKLSCTIKVLPCRNIGQGFKNDKKWVFSKHLPSCYLQQSPNTRGVFQDHKNFDMSHISWLPQKLSQDQKMTKNVCSLSICLHIVI